MKKTGREILALSIAFALLMIASVQSANAISASLSVTPNPVQAGEAMTITVTASDDQDILSLYAWFGGTYPDAGSWHSYLCEGTQKSCSYSWTYIEETPGTYEYWGLAYDNEENLAWSDAVYVTVTSPPQSEAKIKFEGEVIEPDNMVFDDFFDCKVKIDKILEKSGDIDIKVGDEVLVTKWWSCGFTEPGGKIEPENWETKKGDKVEVYGNLSEGYFTWSGHSDSSFLVDLCGSDSYYFKKISSPTTSCHVDISNDKTTYYEGDPCTTTIRFYADNTLTDPSSMTITLHHPQGTYDVTPYYTKISTGTYERGGTVEDAGTRTIEVTATINGCEAEASKSYEVLEKEPTSCHIDISNDKTTYYEGDPCTTTIRFYADNTLTDPSSMTITLHHHQGTFDVTPYYTKISTGTYQRGGTVEDAGTRTIVVTATINGCEAQASEYYEVLERNEIKFTAIAREKGQRDDLDFDCNNYWTVNFSKLITGTKPNEKCLSQFGGPIVMWENGTSANIGLNIQVGDTVEICGRYWDTEGGSFCYVILESAEHYIKKIETCGEILDYAISNGTYPPGQIVIADLKYKSLLSTSADFKGVFKVRSPTGEIYSNSKKESTPAGNVDWFGYNKGNHLDIRIPEDASSGWYDAKLELRNYYTDELCEETEWKVNQFKIEDGSAPGTCINFDELNPGDITGQTLHYDQVDFVAESMRPNGFVIVGYCEHSPPNGISLFGGRVTANFKAPVSKVSVWVGDWAGGTKLSIYAPDGKCLEEVSPQGDFTYYEFSYDEKISTVHISSYEGAFDDFCFEAEEKPPTCKAYVTIEDKVCFGYDVYVDGVYQLTEGQGGTPDGKCTFQVNEGTHTIERRRDGCSEIVYSNHYFQCNGQYKKTLLNYWCNCNKDYKLDEYGVIQQKYDEESAVNKASPTAMVYAPYIDLIPYSDAAKGATLSDLSVRITEGQVTVYSPTESATLSSDGSVLTWHNPVVSDEYDAELMYEASFAHPIEVTATITVSGSEVNAKVKNVANCPIYNVVVLYPTGSTWHYGWHYGTIDSLGVNEETTLTLTEEMTFEDVESALYGYLTRALDESGLDSTDHRNDWLNAWIHEWLAQIPLADSAPPKYPSSIIYRIPQSLYEQYFSCSVSPEPNKGMVRVGLVHLYDIPISSPIDFELISPNPNSELELYKTHSISIKVKSNTTKGGTIVASLNFTSKFGNNSREEIITLKDDDFDGIYEYNYSLIPFEQFAIDAVNTSIINKTTDAETLYNGICDYFSSTIGTYNLTLIYYDESSGTAEYSYMQSSSLHGSPYPPGLGWVWGIEKFINELRPPSEQMWGGHWITLPEVRKSMTEIIYYLSEDNEGTAYIDLASQADPTGVIGLVYGITLSQELRVVGDEDEANKELFETIINFVIGLTPEGIIKKFYDVANDLLIIFKGEKLVKIRLECPANLHMYDSSNNHVGLDKNGNPETEIPYSIYTRDENGSFEGILIIDLDLEDFHEVVIEGTGDGKFNLTSEIIGRVKKQKIEYLKVPVSSNTLATLDISPSNPDYLMKIDEDGDGTTDETKEPDSIETIGCTYDHDGDGIVEDDIDDLIMATDAYLGFNTGSEYDADGDGIVEDDIDDLTMATDAYLGFITCEGEER